MEDWHETVRVASYHVPSRASHSQSEYSLTSLAFDSNENILWTGNSKGVVSSYYSSALQRYTSSRCHQSPIYQILTQDKYVISLSATGIRLNNRRGLLKNSFTDDSMKTLSCMQFGKDNHELMVGGNENEILRVNLDTGNLTSIPYNGAIKKFARASHSIAAGRSDGSVDIIDYNSAQVVRSFNAHGGLISDMDSKENILMTCGYSQRKIGFVLDPLINVYDIRAGKSLPPIPFPAGAGFVRLHPKLSTCAIIASQSGQIQLLDFANPSNVYLHQADISSQLVGLEISPSGDYMALSDGTFVQLWNNSDTSSLFLEYPNPTGFPVVDAGGTPMDVDDTSVPISSVGMPYYKEELLSSWSDPNFVFETGMPSCAISTDSLVDMKPTDFGGYAGYSKTKLRNTAQKYISCEDMKKSTTSVPKFISEKLRTGEVENLNDLFADTDNAINMIPKIYRKLEIKYSKFGINDFDFEVYNHTKYSGLEPQLANAYCNPLLQVYRFSPVFLRFALNHLTHNTLEGKSLLSELGLLFDMLEKANGQHCQARNFLKTLSQIPQASALGLLFDDHESSQKSVSEGLLLQAFSRFLMERIAVDERNVNPEKNEIESIAGFNISTEVKVQFCGTASTRNSVVYNIELYTPKLFQVQSKPTFLQVLQNSLDRTSQTRGWCEECRKYQIMSTSKVVHKLPAVLNIHIPLGKSMPGDIFSTGNVMGMRSSSSNGEVLMDERFWRVKNWPTLDFSVHSSDNRLIISATKDKQPGDDIYDLLAIVVEISTAGRPDNHLISFIRIDESGEKNWYLFNDFLVKQVAKSEVLDFTPNWKSPVMLIYQKRLDLPPFDVDEWKSRLDTSILYRDHFSAGARSDIKRQYKLLTKEEAPKPGTLVAMDAEFVMLQQEETEIISDGTKSLVRPKQLSLARVSVIRGEGPEKGVPFIDDFITTKDTIVDYLTEFSGIEPGDLDPATSKRALVTLQTSYKRLWLLLNLGCVFIGHGLHNDFRTINIQVPKSQVVDTLDIYFLPSRQRRLSLKFLAWYLLNQNVQTNNHDSIEDAHTALLLYTKYQELVRTDSFETALKNVYAEGKIYNFKPPPASGTNW